MAQNKKSYNLTVGIAALIVYPYHAVSEFRFSKPNHSSSRASRGDGIQEYPARFRDASRPFSSKRATWCTRRHRRVHRLLRKSGPKSRQVTAMKNAPSRRRQSRDGSPQEQLQPHTKCGRKRLSASSHEEVVDRMRACTSSSGVRPEIRQVEAQYNAAVATTRPQKPV